MVVVRGLRKTKKKKKCGLDMSSEFLLLNWRHLNIYYAKKDSLFKRE